VQGAELAWHVHAAAECWVLHQSAGLLLSPWLYAVLCPVMLARDSADRHLGHTLRGRDCITGHAQPTSCPQRLRTPKVPHGPAAVATLRDPLVGEDTRVIAPSQ
jgi:hypothetical protein